MRLKLLSFSNQQPVTIFTAKLKRSLGPFQPNVAVEVPLWIAVKLKQESKCRLIAPEWFTLEYWNLKFKHESEQATFTEMPCQEYYEVTKILCEEAPDDIPHIDDIRSKVKDVYDLRINKLKSSMQALFESDQAHAKLNNLTPFELHLYGPFLNDFLVVNDSLK